MYSRDETSKAKRVLKTTKMRILRRISGILLDEIRSEDIM
jgi:hypothetical protein